MHAWYHQKDYLILFKVIPYLLWLFHRGKGSISKYGTRSKLKSCKMNTSGHEESIKNMFFCMELCILFSAGQQRITKLINSMRMRCQALVQALGLSTWYRALIMSLKSINIDEIKDICENKHEHPCKSSPCHFICLCLWLMWWRFCEIKWFESCF